MSQENKGGMAEDALKAGVESTINFIKTKMDDSFIGGFDESFRKYKKFFPLAILYMDKEISIGYQTFVNQFFGPYPLFLATFFPSSVPTTFEESQERRLTKQEVHFSNVASLFTLLVHDYEHRYIINWLLSFFSAGNIPWIEYLRPTYNLISTATPQAQRVLNAGLFLLIHELQYSHIAPEKWKEFHPSKEFDTLAFVIEKYKNHIQNTLQKRETEDYKIQHRDNEYILWWAQNKEGKPFIPLVKIAGKDKFLPVAIDERGVLVIILEVDSHFVKVRISDQEETSNIPYNTDLENNMLLPAEWRLMFPEERRISEGFFMTPEGIELPKKIGYSKEFEAAEALYNKQRQKKIDLAKLRNSYAAQYVMKGFQDFWGEFEALAKPVYNEQK